MEVFLINKPLVMLGLFALVVLFVQFFHLLLLRWNKNRHQVTEKESIFRGVYYIFYLLIAWSCIIFILPLAVTFLDLMKESRERFTLFLTAFFPTIFLCLLWYGGKRGFLEWIKDLQWPNDEKEQP